MLLPFYSSRFSMFGAGGMRSSYYVTMRIDSNSDAVLTPGWHLRASGREAESSIYPDSVMNMDIAGLLRVYEKCVFIVGGSLHRERQRLECSAQRALVSA